MQGHCEHLQIITKYCFIICLHNKIMEFFPKLIEKFIFEKYSQLVYFNIFLLCLESKKEYFLDEFIDEA